MNSRVLAWLVVGCLVVQSGSVFQAVASERSHSKVLAAFRDVVATPSKSTVRVFCDSHQVALGAVVHGRGYVITKASELKGNIECQLHDGKKLPAKIVGRDSALDLAMLKVEAQDLPIISWADTSSTAVGSWVVTPGLEREPVAIGVLSVGPRKIAAPSGALGVQLENDDDSARIAQVMPSTAAERAGIRAGDVITNVNGKSIKGRQELVDTIRGYMPGDEVKLVVQRDSEEIKLTVTLGSLSTLVHGDRAEFQNNLGGPLSERRSGFPSVIQHDTVLRPADCGGPLVNLDGQAIGINIARAGRVESFALTADVVRGALKNLMTSKESPAPAQENLADMSPTTDQANKVQ